jgi:hypothetical protein
MIPGGDHYFSTSPGHREYSVKNDEPFLSVPRAAARIQYTLGTDGGVEGIAIGFPYERRDHLLGTLYSQFGRPGRVDEIGSATIYTWARDRDLLMQVRASRDPQYGIVEFWIRRVTTQAQKPHAGGAS